jgi:NAD(P)-dependent dehydrogenase (short-subunit alcohol dehydrogenase family)
MASGPSSRDKEIDAMTSTLGTLIVTGAGRSIGAAVARLAATNGWDVAVNYGKSKGPAESVVAEIEAGGGRAVAIQGNMAIEADIVRLFETAERELGPIAGLVNNAGITGGISRVADLTLEDLERTLATNTIGPIIAAREAVKRMSIERGGSGGAIVNISSMAAKLGGPGEWVHYAASKGAINSFTIGLAREVAAEGIRVNAVMPGLILSDIHADNGVPDRPERVAPTVPMKRAGTAGEVAEGIVWLLSPHASYVTGTILEIGGGR